MRKTQTFDLGKIGAGASQTVTVRNGAFDIIAFNQRTDISVKAEYFSKNGVQLSPIESMPLSDLSRYYEAQCQGKSTGALVVPFFKYYVGDESQCVITVTNGGVAPLAENMKIVLYENKISVAGMEEYKKTSVQSAVIQNCTGLVVKAPAEDLIIELTTSNDRKTLDKGDIDLLDLAMNLNGSDADRGADRIIFVDFNGVPDKVMFEVKAGSAEFVYRTIELDLETINESRIEAKNRVYTHIKNVSDGKPAKLASLKAITNIA